MQAQYSLHDQLRKLIILADKAGLYDAADYLRAVMARNHYAQQVADLRHKLCGNSEAGEV